ncbi:MAG: aminotransferase class III-fold pyridoxal phosphate-dependent enzyme [Candidatus Zixiibacteriota bacterium]
MKKLLSKKEIQNLKPSDVPEILGKEPSSSRENLICDLRKSNGLYLYDARKQEFYLDMTGFYNQLPIGYNHPRLTDSEMLKQLANASVNKPTNRNLQTVEAARFVETFRRMAMPEEMAHLFFFPESVLSVGTAIRVAFEWKMKINLQKGIDSVNEPIAYCLSDADNVNPEFTLSVYDIPEDDILENIVDTLEKYPNAIGCFYLETIDSQGRDHFYSEEFMKKLHKIAVGNDILMICDESNSGMGITGKLWSYELYNLEPDIVLFGNVAQLPGFMINDRPASFMENTTSGTNVLDTTHGNNLVDMVRARRILEIIEEEALIEKAAKIGKYLQDGLNSLANDYPEIIVEIHGLGLLCSVEIEDKKVRDRIVDKLFENNLITLPCGYSSIGLRPSLTCGKEEAGKSIALIKEAIEEL